MTRAESIERAARALAVAVTAYRKHSDGGKYLGIAIGFYDAMRDAEDRLYAALSLPAAREATPVAWEFRHGDMVIARRDTHDALLRDYLPCAECTLVAVPLVRAPGGAS